MRASNHWNGVPTLPAWTAPTRLPKSAEDYLRALGRRWWIVVFLTLVAGGVGTWFTLQQKPVYFASSRVLIEPPRALVPDLVHENSNPAANNFFNTRIQMFGSREILQRVLASRELEEWKDVSGIADPMSKIEQWIDVTPVQNSNLVDVSLEGTEPATTAKLVNLVVAEFVRFEERNLREFEQLSRGKIDSETRTALAAAEQASKSLTDFHKTHENYLSTGQSVEAARLEELEKAKTQAELRVDATLRAVERFDALKKADVPWFSELSVQRADELRGLIRRLDEELSAQRDLIKPEWYDSDPAIKRLKARRDEIVRTLDGIGKDDAEFELAKLKQEHQFAAMDLDNIRSQVDQQRKLVMAQQEEFDERARLAKESERWDSMADRMNYSKLEIEMHQSLVTPRIQVIDAAEPPTEPVRPIKEVQIPLCFAGGLAFGLVLVFGLEFLNQRVRRAEQASLCLGLPMLGVVPKLGRRERQGWRGVLKLACERPGTRICEAFRNLRMGVLGAEGEERVRSLVVSSPSSGEGKSTVAANLAATCARAGETVLLVDVDLRHPSLARRMALQGNCTGLVESVAGQVHWQEAVQKTQVANLYVLPAGHTAGVPLDILGTAEMHDLLAELCEEFDRVILDGPPLLGLADSRVVGRFADGLLLVVHANRHNARTLGRTRELCDHEGLRPLGIVFNGIRYKHDDLRSERIGKLRSARPFPVPAASVDAPEANRHHEEALAESKVA